jgi:hypothetical protein
MKLYQQSLKIKERLGDLKGKAATLAMMAQIYVTRGDLDGTMHLYQQSLELEERLGDLKGKAATLHAMANVLVTRGDLDGAMHSTSSRSNWRNAWATCRAKPPRWRMWT